MCMDLITRKIYITIDFYVHAKLAATTLDTGPYNFLIRKWSTDELSNSVPMYLNKCIKLYHEYDI